MKRTTLPILEKIRIEKLFKTESNIILSFRCFEARNLAHSQRATNF